MTGFEFGVLRNRLVQHGFRVDLFSYASLHATSRDRSRAARAMLQSPGQRVHWSVSLAARSSIRALADCDAPIHGNRGAAGFAVERSRAAEGVMRWPWLKPVSHHT
jgi:hypothetical protein